MLLSTAFLPPIEYFAVLARYSCCIEACENYQKQSYRNRCYFKSAAGKEILNVPVVHSGGTVSIPIRSVLVDYSTPWVVRAERALDAAYGSSPFFEFYRDSFFAVLESKPERLWDLNMQMIDYLSSKLGLAPALSFTESYGVASCGASGVAASNGAPGVAASDGAPGVAASPAGVLPSGVLRTPPASGPLPLTSRGWLRPSVSTPAWEAAAPSSVRGSLPDMSRGWLRPSVSTPAWEAAAPSSVRGLISEDLREAIHPKKTPIMATRQYWQEFSEKTGFIPNLSVIDLLFNEGPEAICYL